MKLIKNTALILGLIILLAALLRLPLLSTLPAGVTIDEAGQAYSAFSILKTGKDEWGDFLPINPRGFGDYNPPVMMYLLVPSIAVFGLSEFALRFPSAIAGILTVWVMFFLVRDLFNSKNLGLVSSFLLAISPWHVYYSRLGWESNIGLLFFVLGFWLFYKGLDRGQWLVFSALTFGLSALSYHSYKVLVPLMILGLVIIYRKQLLKINKSFLMGSAGVLLVFVFILGYGFIFSGAGRRAADQSLAKEENLSDLRQSQFEDQLPQPFNKLVNNKLQFIGSKVADNYLGYYSLSFLFGPHRSDSSILNFPGKGLFYLWQLPLILLGLFYLFKLRNKSGVVLFLWLLASPVPASLTQDYMHAGRAQALFPALTIISAIGLWYGFSLLKNKQKNIAFAGLAILITGSVFLRIDNYLFHTFNKPLGGLKQGYKEAVEFTEANKNKYDKIIFTKESSEPQAFIAFYSKMDPGAFQNSSKDWKNFESEGYKFLDMTDYKLGKYEFKNIDFSRDRNEKNALIIAAEKEIPSLITPKFKISGLDGKTAFVIVDTNDLAH